MSRTAYRLLVILAVISIIGTVSMQFFWMKKAFDARNQQFDLNIKSALFDVTETLCDINQDEIRSDAIEQISSNYFIVNIDNRILPQSLETLLKTQFRRRGIREPFEYGIFDCSNHEMVYGQYVDLNHQDDQKKASQFPKLIKDQYYFGVYFPGKSMELISQMGIWLSSVVVLFIVVVFFGVGLFFILRQKKLSDIQKDFVNNMTHEFKTPIATISIASDVLDTEEILTQPTRFKEYAKIIKRESTRLKTQTDRILLMSNANLQKVGLKKEMVNLHELVHGFIDSYKLSHPGVSILVNPDERLPDVHGDELHLSNVVSNVLDNAIKYSPDQPRIEVIWKLRDDDWIELSFQDHGKGISKAHLDLIFKQFYRVPTGNIHDVKGFGLGLYYARLVIEAHGGDISAVSQLGKGTTVTIKLPLK